MPTTRLSRSTPFWVLVGGSVVAIGGGAYLLIDKLTVMANTLADGTATGVEVYAGQAWAVTGAVLVGAGLIGLALALTLGALRALLAPKVEIVEAPAWEEEVVEVAETPTTPAVTASEPVETHAEPAIATDAAPETPAR